MAGYYAVNRTDYKIQVKGLPGYGNQNTIIGHIWPGESFVFYQQAWSSGICGNVRFLDGSGRFTDGFIRIQAGNYGENAQVIPDINNTIVPWHNLEFSDGTLVLQKNTNFYNPNGSFNSVVAAGSRIKIGNAVAGSSMPYLISVNYVYHADGRQVDANFFVCVLYSSFNSILLFISLLIILAK